MSLIIQNKNIMKISNNCLVMVFLLLITIQVFTTNYSSIFYKQ